MPIVFEMTRRYIDLLSYRMVAAQLAAPLIAVAPEKTPEAAVKIYREMLHSLGVRPSEDERDWT